MKRKFKPEEYIQEVINSKLAFILPFKIKSIKFSNQKILVEDIEFNLKNKNIIYGKLTIKDLFINQIQEAFHQNTQLDCKLQIRFIKPKNEINCSKKNNDKCLIIYTNFNKNNEKKNLEIILTYLKKIPIQVIIVSSCLLIFIDNEAQKILKEGYKEQVLSGKSLKEFNFEQKLKQLREN